MYLFAQHGSGKSDKIESGLSAGLIRGVVLSPRFERRTISAWQKHYQSGHAKR